jgi:hypothetical protein
MSIILPVLRIRPFNSRSQYRLTYIQQRLRNDNNKMQMRIEKGLTWADWLELC